MSRELEECVAELTPRLLRFAAATIGDWTLAEDVAQEALTALVLRWRRHGRPADPAAFTLSIVRRRGVRAAVSRRLQEPLERVGLLRCADDPLADSVRSERLRRAHAELTAMPKRLRRTLLLRASGFSVAEVARLERCSVSAVKMRVLRARRRLEELERSERPASVAAALDRRTISGVDDG